MKAIELSGLEGFKSLRVADVEKPKPAATAFPPLISEPRPATMGRILVIEDDGALRKILRRLTSPARPLIERILRRSCFYRHNA